MKRPRRMVVWLVTLLVTLSLVGSAFAGTGQDKSSGPIGLPLEEPGALNGDPDIPGGPGNLRLWVTVELARVVIAIRVLPITLMPALLSPTSVLQGASSQPLKRVGGRR